MYVNGFTVRILQMCIHRYKKLARFGLMHMCATNICVWFRAIVVETLHVIHSQAHNAEHHTDKGHHEEEGHVGSMDIHQSLNLEAYTAGGRHASTALFSSPTSKVVNSSVNLGRKLLTGQ